MKARDLATFAVNSLHLRHPAPNAAPPASSARQQSAHPYAVGSAGRGARPRQELTYKGGQQLWGAVILWVKAEEPSPRPDVAPRRVRPRIYMLH